MVGEATGKIRAALTADDREKGRNDGVRPRRQRVESLGVPPFARGCGQQAALALAG